MSQNHFHIPYEERLIQFRQSLGNLLPYRSDALMNLIDSLCSNTSAQSIAELSLNPTFKKRSPLGSSVIHSSYRKLSKRSRGKRTASFHAL